MQKLKVEILSLCAYLLIFALYKTLKIDINGISLYKKKSLVLGFWHKHLLALPLVTRFFESRIFLFSSPSKDGLVLDRFMSKFNIGAIKGSSNKNGNKAFHEGLHHLSQNNIVAITPDGPRGPRYSVAYGIAGLTYRTNSELVLMKVECDKYFELKSWDGFMIPKPFSTIKLMLITCDISGDFEQDKILISNTLGMA